MLRDKTPTFQPVKICSHSCDIRADRDNLQFQLVQIESVAALLQEIFTTYSEKKYRGDDLLTHQGLHGISVVADWLRDRCYEAVERRPRDTANFARG